MHRARDSRGRFIAKAKSSIFTTPSSSRHRPNSPPSTPSLNIFGIQGAAELEDSPIPPTKSHLENKETPSNPPLIEEREEFKDSKETIINCNFFFEHEEKKKILNFRNSLFEFKMKFII